jgi:hypothetical protein
MVMKIRVLLFFLLFFQVLSARAQTGDSVSRGFFNQRDFGKYFVADMYSPVSKLQIGAGTNGTDYNNNPLRKSGFIALEELTLGTDIPIYIGSLRLGNQKFRFSVSGSLSAVVWFDGMNPKSAPILNVDYRVDFPEIHLLKEFNNRHFKNLLLRISLIEHESTHIGDELTLYRKDAGFPITRVNVAYECGDASLTLNDPAGVVQNNHALTIGGRFVYNTFQHEGYYYMHQPDGDTTLISSSVRRLEGYIRYQFDGISGPLHIGSFYPVISAELRQRVRFGYPYYITDYSMPRGFRSVQGIERYAPCLNIYAGWFNRGKPGHPGKVGGFFRYYTGINPYGQFRNLPAYSFIGVALVYETF